MNRESGIYGDGQGHSWKKKKEGKKKEKK